jgi:hypothetical protein
LVAGQLTPWRAGTLQTKIIHIAAVLLVPLLSP